MEGRGVGQDLVDWVEPSRMGGRVEVAGAQGKVMRIAVLAFVFVFLRYRC